MDRTGTERQTIVRTATVEDIPRVAALAAQLVRLHHALDPLRFIIFEPIEPGYGRYLREQLDAAEAVILVAVEPADDGGERIVGYCFGRTEERDWVALRDACGVLHDVLVDASARRLGVAEQLVRAMCEALRAKGAPRVVLMTAALNEGAQALFRKLGFRSTMVEMTRESEPAHPPPDETRAR